MKIKHRLLVVGVILLNLTPCASSISTKEATCPKGFKLYERTATARNKFTKHWCLKVVENEDVYDRPTARSVCMDYDAVITNVETQKELDDVHQSPRMKVFALGLDENQKADRAAEDVKESKIPIESVAASVPHQSPAIFLAKPPKRPFHGFTCGILSWFIGACCLVLLCLAISEVAYHRQRDQAFLRLKWAELRQRMLGYELLSQQQELDRLALEKQKQIEALPLRRSDDPIKPKIVDIIQPQDDAVNNNKVSSSVSSSSEESGVKPV
uniref:Uncharacterized protein n=1 Tax=Caenorhabditis japonica TaxID=281687 RepID=A0A8R1E667_CAEJA